MFWSTCYASVICIFFLRADLLTIRVHNTPFDCRLRSTEYVDGRPTTPVLADFDFYYFPMFGYCSGAVTNSDRRRVDPQYS